MKTDNQIKVESVNPKQMEAAGKDYLWNTFGTFFYFSVSIYLRFWSYAWVILWMPEYFRLFYPLQTFSTVFRFMEFVIIRLLILKIVFRFRLYSFQTSVHSDRFRAVCDQSSFFGYSVYTSVCCLIYLFYKFGESYMDVLFGIFQKRDEVKKIAISYMIKGIVSVTTFTLGMILFHSLMATLLINTLGIFVVLIFMISSMKRD